MTDDQRRGFQRLRQIADWYGHRGAELMIAELTDGLDDMGYDIDDECVIFEAAGLARQETWDGAVARLVLILDREKPFPRA